MKIKTSCEIATIAALVHFGKNPEDGLAWIEEIYNAARREAAAHTVPVNLDPIVDKAIDLGQAVEKEIQRKIRATQKAPRSEKPQKSRAGVEKPKKIKGRRAPNPAELKKLADARTMDERIEAAYLGEHPRIEPEEQPVEKRPLTPAEKRLYDYIVAHPDHTKPQIEAALLISQANYYLLKGQLKKKGWIDGNGVVEFDIKAIDPITGNVEK